MGDRYHAAQLYNKGVEIAKTNDPTLTPHAHQIFHSAAYADPTWWQAIYQCGNNESDAKHLEAAVACYRRALEAGGMPNEDLAKCLTNIGWRLHGLGYSDEALAHSLRAVEVDPKLPYAWVNLSCIYGQLDDSRKSIQSAERAFALEKVDPMVEMALAFACLFGGQFKRGLAHFERRYEYKLNNYLHYSYPRWSGEPDKTVYLSADQGLGDTLSYARFLPAVARRSKYVHACIQHELLRVFQHAFVGIPNLNLMPAPTNFPPADFWTTFVSMPFALGLSDQEIRDAPNIDVPIYGLPKTWKVPDRKLHVGIAWSGSPLNEINNARSVPVHHFYDLYRVPGIQLYSLQVDERRKDLYDTGGVSLVRDLAPYISDVSDTISLLQELDLVITIESALGHICSAANKECWIPYSYMGRDYRVGLTGEDRLWTPRHRVFRQMKGEGWQVVFDRITEALRACVG